MSQNAEQPVTIPNENHLWEQFCQLQEDADFFLTWLGMIALRIQRTQRAVLVLGEPDSGHYKPVAYWPPDQGGASALAELAESALQQRQGMAGQLGDHSLRYGVAFPVVVDEHLYGVVAVETAGQGMSSMLEQALKQLRWGCGWLEARLRQQQQRQDNTLNERLVTALQMIVSVLEQQDYKASLKALVTELAQALDCERVSLGFRQGHAIHVHAVSHTVDMDKKMNVLQAVGKAMDECFDQRQLLTLPNASDSPYIIRDHQTLAEQSGHATLLSIPLFVYGEVRGVVLFERQSATAFSDADLELCRSVAAVIAPILHEKQLNQRSLARKCGDSLDNTLRIFFAAEHYVLKASALLAIMLLAALFVIPGQHRVTADTVLEGKIQRSIVTPFDSFVSTAEVRAGDVVKAGQLLATLDDQDLQLEKLAILSRQGQLKKQHDEAMALRDRARVNIISAQQDEAHAELELVRQKLQRTRVEAPFDGLIIQGDLNQLLGSSMAQGDLLFKIAPLHDYRVIVQVNERYIQYVQPDQPGHVLLSALPQQKFPLRLERVTPVSTAEEGENYFRVEAALLQASEHLRPGMEGVAKITIAERSLAWIWSYEIIDWFKRWRWRWLP